MAKPKWPIADPDKEPTPIYEKAVKAAKTKKKEKVDGKD